MTDLCRFIAAMPAEEDGDLMLCQWNGLAYQRDRSHRVNYDRAYYEKCQGYEGQAIAEAINAGRVDLVDRHLGGAPLVDVGIGSGEFIRQRTRTGRNTWGHDINPAGIEWLKRNDCWCPENRLDCFAGMSLWDVIEHVPVPETYLRHVQLHAMLFVSIPTFDDLRTIRASKHYRPGEHLQYWTAQGFVDWAELLGFMLIERDDFETRAGRDSITSFALQRYRWPR